MMATPPLNRVPLGATKRLFMGAAYGLRMEFDDALGRWIDRTLNENVWEREDWHHWKSLHDLFKTVSDLDFNDRSNHGQIVERTRYLNHMLDAFGRGERFIVAKLAYQ